MRRNGSDSAGYPLLLYRRQWLKENLAYATRALARGAAPTRVAPGPTDDVRKHSDSSPAHSSERSSPACGIHALGLGEKRGFVQQIPLDQKSPFCNSKQHKRFPWLWYSLAFSSSLTIAFCAIGSVMFVRRNRRMRTVQGGEGSVHPCIINGTRLWRAPLSLGVMGWFMLDYHPGGLCCICLVG